MAACFFSLSRGVLLKSSPVTGVLFMLLRKDGRVDNREMRDVRCEM
jgi:hypothetical protein